MRFKKARLGPQLLHRSTDPGFFDQTHVLFGGTGAVGGATAMQMVSLFEEAARRTRLLNRPDPRIIITGRTKQELRQFTRLLFEIQQRDHGHLPEPLDGIGYRTVGGVVLELKIFGVDPSVPGLQEFAQRNYTGRHEAIQAFLSAGKLNSDSPVQDKLRYLEGVLERQVGQPFTQFLSLYREERGIPRADQRFRSVIVGIPLASLAAYKLTDLEEAGSFLGIDRGTHEMEALKDRYLRAIRDDLAHVAEHLADEVLAAHTTAVGGCTTRKRTAREPSD